MKALLRYFSWRYALKHPLRVFLSGMAVALGVALFVSVDVSNTSTEAAFRRTIERLAGNAQLQVVRGRMIGMDEEALKKIDPVEGIKAAPVLQVSTTLPQFGQEGNLLILGLDFRREASFRLWTFSEGGSPAVNPMVFAMGNGIGITKSLSERHSLKLGSSLVIDTPSGRKTVVVGAIVKDEGPARVFGGAIAVMDLKTAQRLFHRNGKCDRIEILVRGDVNDAARRLRDALGPEYTVEPPPTRSSFLDEALTRLRALMGVSVVALLVAIFIIYNSVSISVVERVKEIGTLRALGATRGQIFGVILLEWTLIGVAGSAAGIGLGFALARAMFERTAKVVNNLMLIVDVSRITILPRTLVGAIVLGMVTTFFAALFPARQAMSIAPIEMLRQGLYQFRASAGYVRGFWAGLFFMAGGGVLVAGDFRFANVGLLAAILAFLGAALVLPQITLWVTRAARPCFRKIHSLEGYLAADNIAKFPQRSALTVIALSGALSMMVSASAIVLSFKVRADTWMTDAFPFDCTVNATDLTSAIYSGATFPDEVAQKVAKLDDVDLCYGVRCALQDYGAHDIMLLAVDMKTYARLQRGRGARGLEAPGKLEELLAGRGAFVSENFGALYRVKEGDTIELSSPQGVRAFHVLGYYEDYSWPQGAVFLDLYVYREIWEDPALTYLNIKLKPGIVAAEAKHRIADRLKGQYSLFAYDVADLKHVGEAAMDQTLAFTNIQVTVAMVIGFLGIVNTLLISVMRRMREIGMLRAVGMTRGQVSRMVVIESVLISVVAGILGVALGLIGAKWPLRLHVFLTSGFWMPLEIPWKTLSLALAAAIAIGIVASYVPARRAASVNVLDAIGYE